MEYRIVNQTLVVEPGCEIDHCLAKEIVRITDRMISQKNITMLIMDFNQTVFMDSAGVGMMIGRCRLMHLRGGRVIAIHVTEGIRRIFNMSGLSKIVPCYDSLTEVLLENDRKGRL